MDERRVGRETGTLLRQMNPKKRPEGKKAPPGGKGEDGMNG